ncbi:MFS transporter [Pediococcus siamensis]|uniref:MFS transporter n=1 Tax=Pediococcus siamensis TaxID=381829 RepID=UPI00399F24BA
MKTINKTNEGSIQISDFQSNIQIAKSFSSNFINSLSGKMFTFGLGLMLLDQTRSALSFGINMIISPTVGILFLVPIGNIVDSYKHKNILIASMSVRILALTIFALVINSFSGNNKLIPIILFLIIDAISTNLNDTCYSASIHELISSQKIQRLSSLTQSAISISSILSPTLGVGLYSLLGFAGFISIELIATIISFFIMLSMRFHYLNGPTKEEHRPLNVKSQLTTFKLGLKYMQSRNLIKILILLSVSLNFFYTALTIGIPFVLKYQLHTGNTSISLLETGSAIGMLLGSVLLSILPDSGSQKLFYKLMIPLIILDLQIVLLGITFSFFEANLSIVIGCLIMGIIAFMLVILNITVQVYLQETVPTNMLGRVSSTLTTVNTSIMPLGTLFFTFIFQFSQKGSIVFICNGIILLLLTLVATHPIIDAIKHD